MKHGLFNKIALNAVVLAAFTALTASAATVAKVGDAEYETLDAAITAADAGATVTMLDDVELTAVQTISKAITLDLNGKTISSTVDQFITIAKGGELTINNATGEGRIENTATGSVIYMTGGSLTVEGGAVASKGTQAILVALSAQAMVNVKGGRIEATAQTDSRAVNLKQQANAILNVTDGEIVGKQYGIYSWQGNTVNVSGGTIIGQTGCAVRAASKNTIKILGGTLRSEGTTSAALGISGGSCTVTIGSKEGTVKDVDIPSIDFKEATLGSANAATVYLLSGIVREFQNWTSMTVATVSQGADKFLTGTDISSKLPNTNLLCQKDEKSGLYKIVELTVENAAAVIARGDQQIPCNTVGQAVTALADGDTLTLNADYTGTLAITKKNVTLDLGGHTLTCTGSTGESAALQINQSADEDNTVTVKNGKIETTAQDYACIRATSGSVATTLTLVLGDDLAFEVGSNNRRSGKVVLNKGARTASPCAAVNNGGLLVTEDDGDWIYGETATAFTHANGSEVTLQNDWYCTDHEGAVKVPSSGAFASAKLNLNGKTIKSYGGTNPAILMGAVGVHETDKAVKSLEISNGTILTSHDGAAVCGSNKSLTLDGVTLTTTGDDKFGIYTNGMTTDNTVTLKNGSTVTSETGYGIYFPGAGTLTVEDSNVTGAMSGIEIRAGTLNVSGASVVESTATEFSFTENNNGPTTTGAALAAVKYSQGHDLTVNIAGGTFKGRQGFYKNDPYTDKAGTVTVAISGGTFSTAIDAAYCAAGFIPTENADGTFGVKQVVSVAQVGETKYATLAEAIAAAKSGDTIKLLADVVNTDYTVASVVDIKLASGVTLDGNVKTISGNVKVTVASEGGVTIKNVNFKDIHNAAVVSDSYKTKYGFSDEKVGTLSAIYAPKLAGALTISGCAFENCDWEAMQITPAEGAEIDIRDNVFKISESTVVKEQLRHVHVEMAYGTGFDYEGTDIELDITDNQFLGETKEANMGVWWVGKSSTLDLTGNYYVKPDAVSITLSDTSFQRENRCDLIYPARSEADVDEDNLTAVALVVKDAFNATAHATVAAAIEAAEDTETVRLFTDATEDVTITKSITLDLNGKTLTGTGAASTATVTIAKGVTVVVKNGTVLGTDNSHYTIQNNGTATLEDVTATAGNTGSSMIDNWGTLTINSGTYTGGLNVVKSEEGSKLTINGGTFTLNYAEKWSWNAVILVYGDTTITGGTFIQNAKTTSAYPQVVMTGVVDGYASITKITGGTFVNNFNGTRSGIFWALGKATSSNFEVSGGTFNKSISDGYCADDFIPTKNADGTYGVKEGSYVAQVGSKKYETLAEAIRLAAKGKMVTLLADVKENVTIAKALTLDLNGFTLNGGTEKGKPALTVTAAVTVKDSSTAQTGTIKREDTAANSGKGSHYVIDIQGDGNLVFESGKVTNNSGAGGTNGASLVRVGGDSTSAHPVLTIKGGTFTQDNFIVVKVDDGGTLSLEGGTVNSDNSYAIENWNIANITGGTVNGTVSSWTYNGGANSTLTVTGGTINGDVTSVNYGNAEGQVATVAISGGTVNGSLDTRSYVGGKLTSIEDPAKATIAVSGGTFSNAVLPAYCASGYIPTENEGGTYGVTLSEVIFVNGEAKALDETAKTALKEVEVATKEGATVQYEVVSADGTSQEGGRTLDFATLPNGTYTLQAKVTKADTTTEETKKIVTVGVVQVARYKTTILAVPFADIDGNLVTVATLFNAKAAGLAEDDTLNVYDAKTKQYVSFAYENGAWKDAGNTETKDPAKFMLSRGTAVRLDHTGSDAATIALVGTLPTGAAEDVATEVPAQSVGLAVNVTTADKKVSDITTTGSADVNIFVPTADGTVQYVRQADGWKKMVTVTAKNGDEFLSAQLVTDTDAIPAGTGYWVLNKQKTNENIK